MTHNKEKEVLPDKEVLLKERLSGIPDEKINMDNDQQPSFSWDDYRVNVSLEKQTINLVYFDISLRKYVSLLLNENVKSRLPLWVQSDLQCASHDTMRPFLESKNHRLQMPDVETPHTMESLRYVWMQKWLKGTALTNIPILLKLWTKSYFIPFSTVSGNPNNELRLRLSTSHPGMLTLEYPTIGKEKINVTVRKRIFLNSRGSLQWINDGKTIEYTLHEFETRINSLSSENACCICYYDWNNIGRMANKNCTHIVCMSCCTQLTKCPICRKKWESCRNIIYSLTGIECALSKTSQYSYYTV